MDEYQEFRRETDKAIIEIRKDQESNSEKLDKVIDAVDNMNDKLFGKDGVFPLCSSRGTQMRIIQWAVALILSSQIGFSFYILKHFSK